MNALLDHDFLCYARAARNGWMAHCVELDLDARGRTLAEAQAHLQEAIAAHLAANDNDGPDDEEADRPVVWTVPNPLV